MITLELQIILACWLDALWGDPRWLPHPVKLIGWLAGQSEKFFRKVFTEAMIAGVMTVSAVLLATGGTTWALLYLVRQVHPLVENIVAVLLLYACFAAKDLAIHSRDVYEALKNKDLPMARKRVGMIVGRDTDNLDAGQTARACIESVAENMTDGVIAPLFYAVIGGPLGAIIYKAINTMDSMFGYKNERYQKFGWAAARLDDLANYLPARLTGLFIVGAAKLINLHAHDAWLILKRDRLQHASPNSGYAEAAVAGALGVQLGGSAEYFGKPVRKPVIGDLVMEICADHIIQVNHILVTVTILAIFFFVICRILLLMAR